MGLGQALSTSRNALHSTADQLGNVSRNIAGANDHNYVRRLTKTHLDVFGGAYNTIERMGSSTLLANYLSKSSLAMGKSAYADGLTRLNSIYSSEEFSGSPSNLLTEFQKALQNFANDPAQRIQADAAVSKGASLANALNRGSEEVAKLRSDAEDDIKNSVEKVNNLLHQLEGVEKQIKMTKDKDQVCFSYMDKRDEILKELSQEITITVNTRPDGSIAVYAAEGVTLFDRVPHSLKFQKTANLGSNNPGNLVTVDGLPLTHSTFVSPDGGGRIGSLLKLRDDVTVRYQKQLDGIAKSLMDIFKGDDKHPALFIVNKDAHGAEKNLAAYIQVNPEVFAEKDGNGLLLGDAKRIQGFVDAFDKKRTFDKESGLDEETSLTEYAQASSGWLSNKYQDAQKSAEYSVTMFNHISESLSNATGVNKDDELAVMLQLEQSYGASAKIVTAVSKMMDDLMNAIR